jgi:DNA polymerase-4
MSRPGMPEPPPKPAQSGLRWLYVDFNSYFASVEQQLKPALRGKPIIVTPLASDATCAIAASYEAKAFGIKTGTPVYEAKRLCPGLICVSGNHETYVEFHHRLIDEIDRHIPVTAVCSIDEVACRLMDNETDPAFVTGLAQRIKQGIAAHIGAYVRCSIGVAPNRYLAKVATDLQKPDGLTLLLPKDIPGRLLHLGLRDLPGIGANMERRLNEHGLRDIAQLYGFSPKHLRAIWGSIWGEKMWYLLRGIELPEEKTERRSIGHSHVLAPELRPPAEARLVARRLLMKAASRLRRMDFQARRLSLSVRIENGPRLAADISAEAPASDSFSFLGMLDRLWETLEREIGRQRIKKVSVTLSGLEDEESASAQGDLFAARPAQDADKDASGTRATAPARPKKEKHDKMSAAIDSLNRKFGRDTVVLGMTSGQKQTRDTGTKIAFTRIPDLEEFSE